MASSELPSLDSSPVHRRNGDVEVASGKSPKPADIVGRESELARIADLLSEASDGLSGALLLEGDAGAGKTTLLDAALARSSGFQCLRTRGVADEVHLAHGALLGLLRPLQDDVAGLPDGQAATLSAALGWSRSGEPVDRFLVGAATLTLLATAAAQRAVLVLVDDLQWLDRESREAILFAARRLGPDPVAFLFATRPGSSPDDVPVTDLPILPVGGLSVAASTALLPGLAPRVVDGLVHGTGGNPLALLETAQRLDEAQRSGARPLPETLPGSDRLSSLYQQTIGELSADTRRGVLLLALTNSSASGHAAVDEALVATGTDPQTVWVEACDRGVLVRASGGHSFRHPLVRAAAVDSASAEQVRSAHADLAATAQVDARSRTWHLAGASNGPDGVLADAMAELAEADLGRVGYAAASLAFERSSQLTPEPATAAQRLARAAAEAFRAGDTSRVHGLVEQVLSRAAPDAARGEALFTRGMLEQYAGSVPRSVEYLDQAVLLLDGIARTRALTELAIGYFRLGDFAGIARCAELVGADGDPSDTEHRLLARFTTGVSLMLTGDLERGMEDLAAVSRLVEDAALRHDPRALVLMALAAGFTGQVADAVAVGEARLVEVRRRGALGQLVPALALLAAGKGWLGDHTGAFADAGEAVELASLLGYAADASTAVEMLAWQQASRGLHAEAAVSLGRARDLVERAGVTRFAAHHALTVAYCALCRGDRSAVVAGLEERLAIDGGIGSAGEPLGVAPLLVEAYVAVGRADDARSLAAAFSDVTPPGSAPLTQALVLRCQALVAGDDESAAQAFAAAEIAHVDGQDPFEAARTRLLYGSRLRRAGQRVAARELLQSARDAFDAMGLGHWTGVAEDELAASGATRRSVSSDEQPLTAQETRVALLAAEGLPNKEIAAALFLSPKTIERHLGNVFRKRGFRSRAELAAAYARADRR